MQTLVEPLSLNPSLTNFAMLCRNVLELTCPSSSLNRLFTLKLLLRLRTRVWLPGLHKLRYTSFALPFLKLALEGTLLRKMPKHCFCIRLIYLSPVPLWYISHCVHGAGRTASLAWRSKFHRLLVNLHVAVCKVKGPSPSSTRILNGLGVLLMQTQELCNTMALVPCVLYLKPIKGFFKHFIRQCIRHRLTKDLDAKHERWKRIEKIDIKQTTALYRKMLPSQSSRVAFARLLSNAHATPHRLYKTNAHCTPACRYCSCPDADVIHIAFQCPRFSLHQSGLARCFGRMGAVAAVCTTLPCCYH